MYRGMKLLLHGNHENDTLDVEVLVLMTTGRLNLGSIETGDIDIMVTLKKWRRVLC